MNTVVIRVLLLLVCSCSGWFLGITVFSTLPAAAACAAAGAMCSIGAMVWGQLLRGTPVKIIISGALGTIIGLVIANLFTYSFLSFAMTAAFKRFFFA